MVKLRRADLLIRNGLDLDQWVEPLLRGANNGRLWPGNPGYVDVSRGIAVLGVPNTRVDRSMGDVHPEGNPHFTLDPATAPIVTGHIVESLSRVAPAQRATFDARRRDFLARLDAALARWQQALAPFRGAPVVVYHDTWPYFLERFGLRQAATLENRPGIPPSPAHVADIIRLIKEQKVRVVISEPWADQKLVDVVAREGGARPVLLAHGVGSVKGVTSYLEVFDYNVNALAQVLR
jgi:ABC-type Zn uptake system ZnuABC Zn-binding protein ZnuA